MEKITSSVDGGTPVDIIFLDFAKAFDKVPKNRLLKKLEVHGIGGDLHRWVSCWLTGRRQRVVLNGKYSEWEDVLSGVPQRSVLGPILFNIFINNLDREGSKLDLLLNFADDTKGAKYVRSEEDRLALQQTLDDMVEWADRWGMLFNIPKCKIMHVGYGNPKFEYKMRDTALAETKEERDIGVVMVRNLRPKAQSEKAARTALDLRECFITGTDMFSCNSTSNM